MRRRWPGALVGWTRLALGGRVDRLVARELLVGCGAVAGFSVLALVHATVNPDAYVRAWAWWAVAGLGDWGLRGFAVTATAQTAIWLAFVGLLAAAVLFADRASMVAVTRSRAR